LAAVAPTEEGSCDAATVDDGLSGTRATIGDAVFNFERLCDGVGARGDLNDFAGFGDCVGWWD